MTNNDLSLVYETMTSDVLPRSANKNEDHIVKERMYEGTKPESLSFDFVNGSSFTPDSDQTEGFTVFDFHEMSGGSLMSVVPTKNSL